MPRNESHRQAQRDWYLRNRETVLARSKAQYLADPEAHAERTRAWRASNRDRHNATNRASYARHPEAHRRAEASRRARKANAFVEHVDPLVVLEMDDGICGLCGEDVNPFQFDMDHIVPLTLGGEHSYANVQVAHPSCNRRKGARI